MKAFLITVGIVFGLIVVAHIARLFAEPAMAREPWYMALTVVAGILSGWAWVLLWRTGRA